MSNFKCHGGTKASSAPHPTPLDVIATFFSNRRTNQSSLFRGCQQFSFSNGSIETFNAMVVKRSCIFLSVTQFAETWFYAQNDYTLGQNNFV